MRVTLWTTLTLTLFVATSPRGIPAEGDSSQPVRGRIDARFDAAEVAETPNFRRHVVPLLGKLGCNGRACHGSFQGQGGFRLSLFGYDFKSDHENLLAGDEPRTNLKEPASSLILQKPLMTIPHEGGERLKVDTWQYHVLRRWIEAGAPAHDQDAADFVRVDVTPGEMVAQKAGDTWQLKAVVVWSDGTREDVTPLCRFQTNNDQIATISESGLVTAKGPGDTHVVAFYDNGVIPVPVLFPVSERIGPRYPTTPTPTKIDELVVQKLRKLGIVQSETCTDAEFLRRASLDIIGTLPTPTEIEGFLADSTADKRSRKIDELLERPEYAAWWATKFSDWTGNNARYQQQDVRNRDGASVDWYQWLKKRVAENVPYDQMVEGIVTATSRLPEESYEDYCRRMSGYYSERHAGGTFADQPSLTYYWSRSNFRAVDDRALGFAYTFLGVRIQCAQCHKHPFDQWTKDDFDRFKGFFARAQFGIHPESKKAQEAMFAELEVDKKKLNGNNLAKALAEHMSDGKVVPFGELYVPEPRTAPAKKDKGKENPKKPKVVAGRTAKVLGGDELVIETMDDPRTALMDWMREADNPYFAQSIVNRIWAGYFHRGIVEPTDDLSLANPPCNAELLDHLATGFREHGYDLKWLHREITNSRTYQLTWQSNPTNQLDDRNFSRAIPRRLPAEVAYDAMRQATASDHEIAAMRGDLKGRGIAEPIVDARSNRNAASYALSVFGRSIRESNCDCDRSAETSLLQTVFLQNDQQVLGELTERGGWIDEQLKTGGGKAEPSAEALKDAERQVERAEKQLKKLKEQGTDEERAAAKRRLAAAEAKAKELRDVDTSTTASPAEVSSDAGLTRLVRQAYLRTVSRPPNEAEVGRSLSYFREVGDTKVALRDLLWALMNTKEFIVNH